MFKIMNNKFVFGYSRWQTSLPHTLKIIQVIEFVIESLFNLTLAIRLNKQINDKQCSHQAKSPLVSLIFRC